MSFGETPQMPEAGKRKVDPSKRVYLNQEGQFTNNPFEGSRQAKQKRKESFVVSGESLVASRVEALKSSGATARIEAARSPKERIMAEVHIGTPFEERLQQLKQRQDQMENEAMLYEGESMMLSNGLKAIERGAPPEPEFQQRIEGLLRSAAMELKMAREEDLPHQKNVPGLVSARTEKALSTIAAYQSLLDRIASTSKK